MRLGATTSNMYATPLQYPGSLRKVVRALDYECKGPDSKPQGGSKDVSVLHPSEVNQISTRNSWGLGGSK